MIKGWFLESEQDGDTQNLKSILTDAGFTGVSRGCGYGRRSVGRPKQRGGL